MYTMVQTRPNITYAVGTVSRFLSNLGKQHWNAMKWILRYLYDTSSLKLYFEIGKSIINGYTDSDLVENTDLKMSTSQYLITSAGEVVAWQSKLQRCIALSAMKAEFIIAIEACKELLCMKKFVNVLGCK